MTLAVMAAASTSAPMDSWHLYGPLLTPQWPNNIAPLPAVELAEPPALPVQPPVRQAVPALRGDTSAKAVIAPRTAFEALDAAAAEARMSMPWAQDAATWAEWLACTARQNWLATLAWVRAWADWMEDRPRAPQSESRASFQGPPTARQAVKVRHEPCWPDATCGGKLRQPIPKVLGKNVTLLCCPRSGNLLTQRTCTGSAVNGTVITGTGRAGTSFLMALFSDLGLPTGYDSADADQALGKSWHAGLELSTLKTCYCAHDERSLCIDWTSGVEIYKSPALAEVPQHQFWLSLSPNPNLADVIVPLRDPASTVASRAANGLQNGGWTETARSFEEQRAANERRLGGLMPALAKADVRVTFLHYPRHVLDERYSASKLSWLLERYGVSHERFEVAHRARRDVSLIHEDLVEPRAGVWGSRV